MHRQQNVAWLLMLKDKSGYSSSLRFPQNVSSHNLFLLTSMATGNSILGAARSKVKVIKKICTFLGAILVQLVSFCTKLHQTV